jgi:hypothetical protein
MVENEQVIEVNGIKFSGAIIAMMINTLTHPNPKRWYRFERTGEVITVETKETE